MFSRLVNRKNGILSAFMLTRRLFRAEITHLYHFQNDTWMCIAKNGIFKYNNKNLLFEKCCDILRLVPNKWGRSSAGRAFGSHPRGREFNPLRLHHNANKFVRVCMNSEGGDDRLFCLPGCCKLHKKSAAARFRRVRQRFFGFTDQLSMASFMVSSSAILTESVVARS